MERLTKKFTDGGAYCEEIIDVGIKGINYPLYVGKAVDKLAEYEDLEEQEQKMEESSSRKGTMSKVSEQVNRDPIAQRQHLQGIKQDLNTKAGEVIQKFKDAGIEALDNVCEFFGEWL